MINSSHKHRNSQDHMELRGGLLALAVIGTKDWLPRYLFVRGSKAVGGLPQLYQLIDIIASEGIQWY